MNDGGQRFVAASAPLPVSLLLISLLVTLPLFPPETRSEAAVGCTLLLVLLVLLAPPAADAPHRKALVVMVAVLGLLAGRAALAPGAAVEPVAIALLGVAGGLAARESGVRGASARAAAVALAVAGGVVSLHALSQKVWGLEALAARVAADPDLPDRAILLTRLAAGRAFAAFPTPAALGGFLALAGPVTVGLAVAASSRRSRVGWGAVLLLQAAGLVASASASAAGALVVAVLLAAALHPRLRRPLFAAVGGVVLVLVLVVVARGSSVVRLDDPQGPWRLRAGNFRAASEIAVDHPWIGVGPGGFSEVYPSYRRPGDNETRHVHDLPLELVAEIGIPAGLLVSGLFFVVFLGPVFRGRGESGWQRGVAVGLCAFAVQNLVDFTAFLPSLLWTACIVRGAAVPRAENEPTAVAGLAGRLLGGLVLAAVALAATLVCASALARDERGGARVALASGRVDVARERTAVAATVAPWDVDVAVLRARAELGSQENTDPNLGQLERALDLVERAVALSPVRPAARELRATIRWQLGDLPGAYSDLVVASRLYPMRGDYAAARDRLAERLDPAMATGGATAQ